MTVLDICADSRDRQINGALFIARAIEAGNYVTGSVVITVYSGRLEVCLSSFFKLLGSETGRVIYTTRLNK